MDKRGKKIAGTMLYVPGVLLMVFGIIYLPITASMSLAVAAALGGAAMTAAGLYLNHSHKTKTLTARTVRYVLLSLGAVIMMFPFYWMLSSAFKTSAEMNLFPPSMAPNNWFDYGNFVVAFETAPFARYFMNSVIVVLSSVVITAFTTILGAFAFSRLKFPGKEILFSLLLSMMMVPFEILVITNYQTIVKIGLSDTLYALVLPFISSIFYTYILRNFFSSIPDGLYWSARVDGCTNWRYLWKIMVPIGRPALMTIILLNAMASWNSFMWPLLVIKRDTNRTLPFGLYSFTTEVGANNELLMAASSVVVMPMILLFFLARKQIVNGVARGGIKG